jgi:hypothetical protein
MSDDENAKTEPDPKAKRANGSSPESGYLA